MKELSTTFKALSDETRLRIVKLLEHGEICVCDIVAALNIVQPKASFHLRVLRGASLIKDRKQGKWIHYSLNETDLFRRMLMVSICEKTDGPLIAKDQKRLARFLKNEKARPDCAKANIKGLACRS